MLVFSGRKGTGKKVKYLSYKQEGFGLSQNKKMFTLSQFCSNIFFESSRNNE